MADRMPNRVVEPQLLVVFGATGDLMERKLLPALFHLARRSEAGGPCVVLGAARNAALDDTAYRAWARPALRAAGMGPDEAIDAWCARSLHYLSVSGDEASFAALADRIRDLEREHRLPGNRAFYLALPPGAVTGVIRGLGSAGLGDGPGWTRIVVEKPFGRDLSSARDLNAALHRHFTEPQIFRIDHYLGKETVQNLLVLRFANPIFESLWNRDRIESVQITVAEGIGVDERAGYYDDAGAIRDMMQSHLTQLLSLIAMEVPVAFDADAIRGEKVKVLRAIAPIAAEDVVRGQYGSGVVDGRAAAAYRGEKGVAAGSRTETYAAVRLEIDNWRWQGVPFYLRTGKRLPRRLTQIVIHFRRAPVVLFTPQGVTHVHRNILAITLQPDEGFDLFFDVKAPGNPFSLATHALDFRYADAYGSLSDAYETLVHDVMTGDPTLFVRGDEVEASWALYTPLVADPPREPELYAAGTWGPSKADALLERSGQYWAVL